MSYVQLVLRDYVNFSQIEGIALAKVLFDAKGNLMPSWREDYTEWLNSLANRLALPDNEFRRCWIDDALDNANPDMDEGGDLQYIKDNLFVEDVLTDTCVRCGLDKSQGQYLEDERFMCDDCEEEIRKAANKPVVQEQQEEHQESEGDYIAVPARVKPPRRRVNQGTHAIIKPNDFIYLEELLTPDYRGIQLEKVKRRVINKSDSTILINHNNQDVRLTLKPERWGNEDLYIYSNKAKLLRASYWRPKAQ